MRIWNAISKITAITVCVSVLLLLVPLSTVRAASTLTLSVSGSKEVGATFSVTVGFSGDDASYAGYNGYFSYDSALVRLDSITKGNYTSTNFVSATSTGSVEDHNATIPNGSSLCVATFTCLAAGTVSISADFTMATMSAVDVAASASASVVITAAVPKSSDATLRSLTISPGTLSPAFSSGTQNYSATVSTSKITVSAVANSSKATVTLNGTQNSLTVGENTVKITVLAEDGSSKVYKITVTRLSGPTPTPTPTPVPLPLMNYKGTDYTILTATDADGIPAGFVSSVATYQDVDIPVLSKTVGTAEDASQILLVYLVSDALPSYFVYDDVNDTCYPYSVISQVAGTFQIVDQAYVPDSPDGYEVFDYDYNGTVVTAYRLASNPENPQILLYLCDENGISAYYYYDTENGMLMLYRGEVSIVESITPQPSLTPSVTVASNISEVSADKITTTSSLRSLLDYRNPVSILFYIVSCIAILLMALAILLLLTRSRKRVSDKEVDLADDEESGNSVDDSAPMGDFLHEYAEPKEERDIFFGDAISTDLVLPPDTNVVPDSSASPYVPDMNRTDVRPDEEDIPFVQISGEGELSENVPGILAENTDELRAEILEEAAARAELMALSEEDESMILPVENEDIKEPLSAQSNHEPEPEVAQSYLHIPVRLRHDLENSQNKPKTEPVETDKSQKAMQKPETTKLPAPPKKSKPDTYDPDFD